MVVKAVHVHAEGWQSTFIGTVWVVVAAVFVTFFVVVEAFGAVGGVALIHLCVCQSVVEFSGLGKREEAFALWT